MSYSQSKRLPALIILGIVIIFVVGLIGLIQPGIGKASGAFTFAPVADTYIHQAEPGRSFGQARSIRVDGVPLIRSFLKFDVRGIGAPVSRVTLKIFANSASASGFDVYRVNENSWQEQELNFNNAPVLGDKIGSSGKISANSWVEIQVNSLLHTNGPISLALVGIDSVAINLASREEEGKSPQLLVETSTIGTPSAERTTGASVPVNRNAHSPDIVSSNALPFVQLGATPTPTEPPSNNYQPSFPIRATFYYPWFPESWVQQGYDPFTNYTPSLGFYDSSTLATIRAHITAMTYANMDAAILSWWGQGSETDQRVATILQATPGSSNPYFRWSIYYEDESMGDPSSDQIKDDLAYTLDHYGTNSSFLRVNGKFVVFVYADTGDACGMADRWVQANDSLGHPAYIVLKVFNGYRNCASQPDSWHQYSPAKAADQQAGFSYTISPGFWKKGESPVLERNMNTWFASVTAMVATNDPWQLVTTFNEWGEGTSVESAVEWESSSGFGQYLDVLHNAGKSSQPVEPLSPASTIAPPDPNQTLFQTLPIILNRTSTNPCLVDPSLCNDPILFYVSDLVSSSSVSRGQAVVDLIQDLIDQHPGVPILVASGGDNEQENNPTISNYEASFGTTYGTFVNQGIYMQVRGNHDAQSVGSYVDFDGTSHNSGAAYWDYFGSNAHMHDIEGKKLTDYSYDLGTWHIIALDQLSGSVNNPTLNFLTADLAAHSSSTCQLVYWHVPTYSSGAAHGDSTGLIPLNQQEYNAGVDIQLNGHDHNYQRFYPINPSGIRDDAHGITTFVAGIGGQDNRTGSQVSEAQAASAVYMDTFPGGEGHAIGVLMFTLHASSADYSLYNANTGEVLDQGTVPCH